MSIYLDNAATTPLAPEVLDAMVPYLKEHFGNPSSVHAHGRETRSAIEKARKKVAALFNCSPSELFFTSGGTEADNTAILSTIRTYNIKHAITSPIEHHAVLHSLQALQKAGVIQLSFVDLDKKGNVVIETVEKLLAENPGSFVSLMHANNEIGNITDIGLIGALCEEHRAFFHSDTVQTIAHFPIDLGLTPVDFITGSAHKFHGPKGVGFLYIKAGKKINPFIEGGAQERNMRGGTENVAGIVGLAKALEQTYEKAEESKKHIVALKSLLIRLLQEKIPGTTFNGESANLEKSLFSVLNASLPASEDNDMLLFNLDIKGISVSGGSACTSGSLLPSHVLSALGANPQRGHVRFSFSALNTEEEIHKTVETLQSFFS